MCLMPAYFAMHELIRSYPNEMENGPYKSIQENIITFMDSFSRPARLLYSQVHQSIKPVCGITPPTAPGFRLDSTNLILTSIKGAMRYPDFLTSAQVPLLCYVLGQLRSTELTAGMLDSSTGKAKTRSVGLELALVDWIVDIMQVIESIDDCRWVRTMFEHLISVVITFMLGSTIRFNEIVVKLNAKLTDFVPCLRLFDILFPDAEDPARAIELQTLGCKKQCRKHRSSEMSAEPDVTLTPPAESTASDTQTGRASDRTLMSEVCGRTGVTSPTSEPEADGLIYSTDEGSDEDVCLTSILPPVRHRSGTCCRRQTRWMHLATAPVCLWQHVLRKSRTGHDHLPRAMPPALRPIEARISYRMRSLVEAVENFGSGSPTSPVASQLTWKELFIVLNAYSTDNEAGQLIQHVIDMFWHGGEDEVPDLSPYATLWPKLFDNGSVCLPYGLVARGKLHPLPNHLIRTMSVHLRMLVLHLLLQKLATLQFSEQLTTPAVAETMCRILTCREVEPSNISRILNLLPKLQPICNSGSGSGSDQGSNPKETSGNLSACYLLSTLLDTLGHRLVDTFLPEVRVQCLVTFVTLLRMWTALSSAETEDPKLCKETGKGQELDELSSFSDKLLVHVALGVSLSFCIKMNDYTELLKACYYSLDWTICKVVRSLQTPDCVIYGLCSAITLASLAQAQAAAAAAAAASSSTTTATTTSAATITTSTLAVASSASNMMPTGPNCSTFVTASGIASQTNAVRGSVVGQKQTPLGLVPPSNNSSSVPPPASDIPTTSTAPLQHLSSGYPFLMTEFVELNRLTLFGLLQIYYAFDLDEASAMKAFLVEQVRTMCDRCGPSSLSDLPRLISSRLPEFLVHTMRQRASPNVSSLSGAPSGDCVDKRANLSILLSSVVREFTQLTDGETTWASIDCRGNLIFCIILRLSVANVNARLRTLCDYVVACLSTTLSGDDFMSQKCLSSLCDFCVAWRVVPLDRFLMFLLTHTSYQGTELDIVNGILVYVFIHCAKLSEAIDCMQSLFPVSVVVDQCDYPSGRQSSEARSQLHPDPLSSRRWAECVSRLHELIPDQGVTDLIVNTATSDPCKTTMEYGDGRAFVYLPVLYGHLTLRLLPLVEAILAQFLETNLPLVHLIPFCRAVVPLFRFHRRPINVCYVLLREHWHFVPPETENFLTRELQTSCPSKDGRLKWLVDRLRVQLIVYCVLCRQQELSTNLANSQRKRLPSDATTTATAFVGLLTQTTWTELRNTFDACVQAYEAACGLHATDVANAERELECRLYAWFKSREICIDAQFVPNLLEPILRSMRNYGLLGHPAAWRSWHLEESVNIQSAGLYAGAVEIMCSFFSPREFVSALTEFLCALSNDSTLGGYMNVVGAFTAILPVAYRLALCQFAVTLFTDSVLTDPTTAEDWHGAAHSADAGYDDFMEPSTVCARWRRSKRKNRHSRLLHCSTEENLPKITLVAPPRIAVNFFRDFLPPQLPNSSNTGVAVDAETPERLSRSKTLLKASLWHAVWAHANATQLTSLPSFFAELILPQLRNEAQLLMSFYLVAPLMGSLHTERPAKLIDLTAELYRAVQQVDSCLASGLEPEHTGDGSVDNALMDTVTANAPIPMVHVDTIADLLYHIKYMYVGNGVLEQVRPLLPKLRANLRKRLKFILPPSESFIAQPPTQLEHVQSRAFPGELVHAVYEGRIYRAATKPPFSGEDF
ncbi:mediator of RNA polymerase II transcription subunit 23 [Paragonimus westermani]|uniref:Mediator of RNA polymerase II transcription subunit 23 n=1 Tax=Paragonimus westermani TaxID=34504 RepID=A0A5J4P0J8_9TREM|nr:mediator of RNA polymerase II transcription subunit 23 [Paragonimus westermani]